MPEGWLQGKTAIVTGAGRGIGRAVALKLAEEGANVVVVDPGVNMDGSGSDAGPAQQVVDEIKTAGGNAVACLEAVGAMEAGERIIQITLETFQKLDIVVNVAGILRDRMIFNMAPEEWHDVIQTHLKGTFSTVKPASILFRQQRSGRIVNFCSVTGNIGAAGQANYGAAKGGIAGMTRVVARDLGRYGVTCNAVSPGASTRMTATIANRPPAAQAGAAAPAAVPPADGPPPRRMHGPEHIAPMVAYLASDVAWNVNGQIFAVQGGTVSVLNHPLPSRTIYKPGLWTTDELDDTVPSGLLAGTTNPTPPAADVDVPGRPPRPELAEGVQPIEKEG